MFMKKISQKKVYDGKWLSVLETIYENKHGQNITWESVQRKKTTVGVVVVARLMPSKKFILIKQFRAAVGGYVISFPAGLSFGDPNHALVELKEETGYVGQIVAMTPALKTGSSIIDDTGQIVIIEVDENHPANSNPQQELEPAEDITVHLVEKEKAKFFFEEQQSQGVYVASNLWYLFGLWDLIERN